MEPTAEQQAARDIFVTGQDLALIAGAGTGKTSTLVLMGNSTRKRGLYIAFNRGIADDARGRFGRNVECRTAHSLAYRAGGHAYQERLNASARLPAKVTARLLGIRQDLFINSTKITVKHQARLVMGMVRRFCYTTDPQIMARHMERLNGLDGQGQEDVASTLLPFAVAAWEDLRSLRGRLRFEHDHYMKMWAMTGPRLEADFVLLDEAQDTNPVLEEVFLAQDAQRICVGDPAQQIYAWRNAQDVMTGFPAQHLHLTQSFRFGPRIAEVANRWLRHAESDMTLLGHGPADSTVGPAPGAEAVLCRGNADAMSEVMDCLEADVPVALTGGGDALHRIANAAQELKAGRRTSHPELFLFTSWQDVQEYVEQDKAGQDLKAIVQLVDTYGPETIIAAVLNACPPEGQAKVTVSTAHKAKGREWSCVRIGEGFTEPSVDEDGIRNLLNPAEARLIYVAVTRARHRLDPSGVRWIDSYEKATQEMRTGSAGHLLIDLALTAQLRYPTSPISRFMAEHLPGHRTLAWDYYSHLRDLPHPVQPIDVQHPNWSALGHAIDYRLRLSLRRNLGDAVAAGVASCGSGAVSGRAWSPATGKAVLQAGRQLLHTVDRHRDNSAPLGDEDLSRLCFVAAFYEDVYRVGELRRYSMLAAATPGTTLEDLLAAVPSYVPDDLARQLALAKDTFKPFQRLPDDRRICGPVFTGSADIGGADADFIIDGTLIDCKATTQPRRLGRDEIYQLAGYLLLDYDDRYGIDRVGLYLSRQGSLISWNAQDFLQRLGSAAPLGALRDRFRRHLQAHRNHQTQRPHPPASEFPPASTYQRTRAETPPPPAAPPTAAPLPTNRPSQQESAEQGLRLAWWKTSSKRMIKHVTADGRTTVCKRLLPTGAHVSPHDPNWHLNSNCYNCSNKLARRYEALGYFCPINSEDYPPRSVRPRRRT